MLVNSAGLEPSTLLPGFPTDSFLAFALAVPFIQGALFATMNAGTELARDIQTGFLNRLSLTSLRGSALLAGHLAGVVVLGIAQAVFYIAVGLVLGVDFAVGPGGHRRPARSSRARLARLRRARRRSSRCARARARPCRGMFPLLFVFLFISSMNTPRDLIAVDWFRLLATLNPVSYLIECVRSLIITGWDARGARARLRDRDRSIAIVSLVLSAVGAHAEDDADMSSSGPSRAESPGGRSSNLLTTPALLLPTLLFPLFFFTAFAGGLSQVQNVPGFDYPGGYTSFQFVFVLLQSAAFGGVFTGFGIARDFESGFGKRLLLASPNRVGILLGYAIAALARWTHHRDRADHGRAPRRDGRRRRRRRRRRALRARAAGQHRRRSSGRRASRCASGRSRPGRMMQMPVFLLLFFAPVYVPLDLLTGWIEKVATVNPITYVLEAGREPLSGTPSEVALALLPRRSA